MCRSHYSLRRPQTALQPAVKGSKSTICSDDRSCGLAEGLPSPSQEQKFCSSGNLFISVPISEMMAKEILMPSTATRSTPVIRLRCLRTCTSLGALLRQAQCKSYCASSASWEARQSGHRGSPNRAGSSNRRVQFLRHRPRSA